MYARTIILVTQDAGLRSAMAARLGMEGITLITVDSCLDPKVGEHLRRATLLIIDDAMICDADRADLTDRLRRRSVPARIVLLTDASDMAERDGVWTAPKRNAAGAILKLLENWRAAPPG